MTDTGRKDLSNKMGDKMTPDSSKSTVDKIGDSLSGNADKAGREAVPDSKKSTSQSMQDKVSREKDHKSGEPGVADKVKGALGMDSNTKH